MDNKNKINKCSSKNHSEINAISYCSICKKYMCNQCQNFHSNFFVDHPSYSLNEENIDEIFTGFCKEENHKEELDYFCKTHNQLCCAKCISKIQSKGNGNHKDCDVCNIEDIKDEKINILNENIQNLEKLSETLQNSIDNLKSLFKKINESKDELKIKIQKIFSKIRIELNDREDELILEVDKLFEKTFFKEDIINEGDKLPEKTKLTLENCKLLELDKENENNKLSILINKCINIEKNIKDINNINETIKKCNKLDELKIEFTSEKDEKMINLLKNIKEFGELNLNLLNCDLDSIIISNNSNQKNSIINWIKEKTNQNKIEFELIFRMSENGTNSKDFHKYCDNKGPTLVLVKTTKDKIFGGFTPLSWKNEGGSIKDESNQTFIFSLNLNKKFDLINKNKVALQFLKDCGPSFGYLDFNLNSDMKKGQTYADSNCNFLSNNNLELTGGKASNETFDTEELEIFKVIY